MSDLLRSPGQQVPGTPNLLHGSSGILSNSSSLQNTPLMQRTLTLTDQSVPRTPQNMNPNVRLQNTPILRNNLIYSPRIRFSPSFLPSRAHFATPTQRPSLRTPNNSSMLKKITDESPCVVPNISFPQETDASGGSSQSSGGNSDWWDELFNGNDLSKVAWTNCFRNTFYCGFIAVFCCIV